MSHQVVDALGHTAAGVSFLGWLVGVLPPLATFVTFVWFLILITEKSTGKSFHTLILCAIQWVKTFIYRHKS